MTLNHKVLPKSGLKAGDWQGTALLRHCLNKLFPSKFINILRKVILETSIFEPGDQKIFFYKYILAKIN